MVYMNTILVFFIKFLSIYRNPNPSVYIISLFLIIPTAVPGIFQLDRNQTII